MRLPEGNPMSTKEAREALASLFEDAWKYSELCDGDAPATPTAIIVALDRLDARRASDRDAETVAIWVAEYADYAPGDTIIQAARRVLAFLDGCSVTHNAGDGK